MLFQLDGKDFRGSHDSCGPSPGVGWEYSELSVTLYTLWIVLVMIYSLGHQFLSKEKYKAAKFEDELKNTFPENSSILHCHLGR